MINEINIICIGNLKYRFGFDIIESYGFSSDNEVLNITFKDGAFVEFQRRNIIAIEVNKNIELEGGGINAIKL